MQIKSVLYMISGILFGLFVAALVWVTARNPSGEAVTLRPVPTERPIVVQVSGAVPRPGVYALPDGARVQDLISAAGGFLAEADKELINLARVLEDGERLDVPYGDGFSPVIPTPIVEIVPSNSELININIATTFELEALPGIGPTLAGRIVNHRDENGPFQSIEAIQDVSGIGPALYERIKDLITVER
jgi:competence protein ComEA